jgi:thiosulfate reductase/polysulfide reductase chain A
VPLRTESRSRRTACCHCEARCGVVVEVDERGLPRSIVGDRADPVSRGFICVRGQAAIDYFSDPRRLSAPLKRSGPRGSGSFTEVSWDEALGQISEHLLRIAADSGPESVALLQGRQFGADSKFGSRLMHQFGSPNVGGTGLMCGGPQFAAGALTFGFGPTLPEVIPGVTQLVVVWGQHPSASAPPYWGRIREATRSGARLVVIDPRPTLEARAADLWIQLRPASDAALALATLNVVVGEDLWDHEFVTNWTHGFDDLEHRVASFGPEEAEAVTGVPAAQVRELARLYATTPAAALSIGTPNGQGKNALNFERSLSILIALTGKLDREGCNRLTGPTEGVGSEVTYDAYAELPQSQRARRLGAQRFRLHGEGAEILSEAATRVWYGVPNSITRAVLGLAHPIAIFNAIETGDPYPVRGLLVQHHNPIGAYSGSARVARALASDRLELLVVHELKLTPTAMFADYVLPAASWMEKPFLFSSGWGTPIMAGEQVVEAQHQRKSDFDFCRDLGRRLGQTWPDNVEEVFDEWLDGTGYTYDGLLDGPRTLAGLGERRRFEQIDAETGEPYGFATPTGKVELWSTVLDSLGYDALPTVVDPPAPVDAAARYPLRLMTGATRIDATHQDHRHVLRLRARHPDPVVEIDPATAAQLGVREGDWVRVVTPAGEVHQRAHLVAGLGTDRVSAERWWYPEREGATPTLCGVFDSNVNSYTDNDLDSCDPAYGALPYRDAYCRIERMDSEFTSASGELLRPRERASR